MDIFNMVEFLAKKRLHQHGRDWSNDCNLCYYHVDVETCDWLEDEKVYVTQEEELKAFTDFFMKQFAKK